MLLVSFMLPSGNWHKYFIERHGPDKMVLVPTNPIAFFCRRIVLGAGVKIHKTKLILTELTANTIHYGYILVNLFLLKMNIAKSHRQLWPSDTKNDTLS